MTITDEKLSAYLDGELAPDEMDAIRNAIENDNGLRAQIEKLIKADQIITAAYHDIDNAPMPQSVMNLLAPRAAAAPADAGNVASFPRRSAAAQPRWAIPMAAAVALAIGVGVGLQFAPRAHRPSDDTILLAEVIDQSSPIHQILESTRSAQTVYLEGADGASMTPVLTFKSASGDYCREFMLAEQGLTNRAVACRRRDGWAVQFAAANGGAADPDVYATASVHFGPVFDAAVDALIDDAPLSAADELALIQKKWRD